jgi:single-strand DNA-binding protein
VFNLVVLTGRLTADPELKTTPTGVNVTSFSIAVSRRYRSGEETQADFINIVAWRQTAEFITKYFKKGSMIGIEGSIQTRRYVDKDGKNRTVFEVVANNVQFVEAKRDGAPAMGMTEEPASFSNASANEFTEVTGDSDDDLPF